MLGPGLMGEDDETYSRIEFSRENLHRFNEKSQVWIEQILDKLDPDGYVSVSTGMLMGMMNAGSTNYATAACNYRMQNDPSKKATTLRSSDDSMTVFLGSNGPQLQACLQMSMTNLKLAGINISPKKSFYYPLYYGEYTSWYQDGTFVSQYGVETASMRPQGKNPPDDFNNIAKGTAVSQQTLTINPVGATARLVLGIDSVRRLYRINRNPIKRPGVSDYVLMLSDGGASPWDCMNCHLEETCLKERLASTQEEKEYLLRIRNPDNPVSATPEEEITYSKDTNALTIGYVETPRTVFHYMRRTNRTANNSVKKDMFEVEKANSAALKIVNDVDPTTLFKAPTVGTPMHEHIIAGLNTQAGGLELSMEDRNKLNRAIAILKYGISEDPEDEDDLVRGFGIDRFLKDED